MLEETDMPRSGVKSVDDLLTHIRPKELEYGLQLLALSVAHHRQKYGSIALEQTFDHLLPGLRGESLDSPLFAEGEATLRECLDLVAEAWRPAAVPSHPQSELPREDNRRQARVPVSAALAVTSLDGRFSTSARTADISWGGLSVELAECELREGEEIRLSLPGPNVRGEPIEILANIVHKQTSEQGVRLSTRITGMNLRDEFAYHEILKLLLKHVGQGEGTVERPLTANRIDLEYADKAELAEVFDEIGKGRLWITLPDPVELNSSLQLMIVSADGRTKVALRARAVHQHLSSGPIEVYEIGLEFEHPGEQLRADMAFLSAKLRAA